MVLHLGFTLALASLSSPALADALLPIKGVFGNKSGCAYFMTGELLSDDLLVLTPDTFTTYGTGCYFERLIERTPQSYTMGALCTAEGEEGSSRETLIVVDRGAEGMLVDFKGLGEFGPMLPCPGTAQLFEPRGTRV